MFKYKKKIKILLGIFVLLLVLSSNVAFATHLYWHIGECPEGTVETPNGCGPANDLIPECQGTQVMVNNVCVDAENTLTSDTKYPLLAPIGEFTVFDVEDGECPFGRYINLMITVFLGIAAVLAMLMIIMGGLEYMTSELVSSKEAGRAKITHAVLGLLLALAAYLILNTINPSLLNLCLDIKPQKIAVESEDEPQEAIMLLDGGYFCTEPSYKADTKWDYETIKAKLPGEPPMPALPPGVGVKTPECTTVGQSGCTTTRGLNMFIVKKIKDKCPECTVFITEGTGCWKHKRGTSHKIGSPTVDLRDDYTNLNEYITDGKKMVDWHWYSRHGINYLKEPDHWHAQK